ncbi:MAG: FAD-dependent oxidoreductase [Planctomycetia bacterium]|nr:FAD-dependent oxidoreductase [Planctomycetia bacterium]
MRWSMMISILFLTATLVWGENRIFVEAESFEELGGWVVDPHSMGQMGSSYVMAHGYGKPVMKARTRFHVSQAGSYTAWVRTRDWTAVWKRGTPAGRFQLEVNGRVLEPELGTNGEAWSWQKAGEVELSAGQNEMGLCDLTGFNGRCDAVYFTSDRNEVPENEKEKLAAFRKKLTGVVTKDYPEKFDLVVIGGGVSGMCTALSAGRLGCSVVLLQDREVVGGCNSSEIRVGMGGQINIAPYPNLGNTVGEIQPMWGSGGTYSAEYYEDARKKIALTRGDSGVKLLTREHVFAVEMDPANPKKIVAVISRNTHTGQETRFAAPMFVDATGDAVIARMAGCEVMYGREARDKFNEINAPVQADRQVMGHSVLWYARTYHEQPVSFPDIDWAIPFSDETVYPIRGGDWEQEAGQYRDMADETEYIRDYGLLSIYSNWSFLVNHSKRKEEFNHYSIDWVSPIGGKRESYRVMGDLVLTQNDLEEPKIYPDCTATITWDIDLHFPDPWNVEHFGEPFRSCAYHRGFGAPYPVPYRCLYARDCNNLFLAGRHISVSHVAFAAVRVMRTLGTLGEVAGMAAVICKNENCTPREVYTKHLETLISMMKAGVPKARPYHTGGVGLHEKYHFKDLGWHRIYPNPSRTMSKEVIRRIRLLEMVHRNEHPFLKDEKYVPQPNRWNIFCADEITKPLTIENETLELVWGKEEHQNPVRTANIRVGKAGVLFCNVQNALGIWTDEAKTLPESVVVEGVLRLPEWNHVNVGVLRLENGTVESDGEGNGSEIMGNVCFAGRVTAVGNCRVTARRAAVRAGASPDGESGVFDTPAESDRLEIESDIHGYHGGKIVKTGKGTLVLTHIETPLPIEVREGTLVLRRDTPQIRACVKVSPEAKVIYETEVKK